MPYADKEKQRAYMVRRRQRIKERAIEYLGGSCQKCGYKTCVAALHFHHPNNDKEFGIGAQGIIRSWERVKAELDKCILLCANCHAETHHQCDVV